MAPLRDVLRRFCLVSTALLAAFAVGACGHTQFSGTRAAWEPAGAMPMTQPDLQILIVRSAVGQETVDLTYPKVVPPGQAHRDVDSITQAASLQSSDVEISNSALPMAGVKATPMTSATFATQGAVPYGSTCFRLEPWIVALRSYPNLAITYLMPSQFVFNGLRSYRDQNVQIALDQIGQSYTYHVHVLDGNFDHLNLPLMQPDPQAIEYANAIDRRATTMRAIGIVLVSIVAAGAGYAVYILLSRLQ